MAERNYPAKGSRVLHRPSGVTGIYKGMIGNRPRRAALVVLDIEHCQKYAEQMNCSIEETHAILVLKKDLQAINE